MRLAAVVALVGLLFGLLWAAGAARADAPPDAGEPQAERWSADPRLWLALIEWRQRLRLELTSSREICTAGTLTEVSWAIAGGKPPYSLQVEGASVAVDADSVRINCGVLSEAEAADGEADLAAKRIAAVVTDSRGARREAAIGVTRVRALPALVAAGDVRPYANALRVSWDGIDTSRCGIAECYVVRWRSVGGTAWTVEPFRPSNLPQGLRHYIDELAEGAAYEAAAAAIRDRIEIETPDALNWTAAIQGATLTAPTGLTATSTHDTITLRWDRQPSAQVYFVFLNGPDGGLRNHLSATDRDTWGDASSGFHEVVFRNLSTDTEFNAIVASLIASENEPGLKVQQTVRTKPAPAGYEELPRGPQNLRVTITHTTITARWDEPFSGAPSGYLVRLYHPAVETAWFERVWAPDLAVTFSGLQPTVTYRLSVEQLGPVANPVEVSVATTRPPPGAADAIPPGLLNPELPPPWPPRGPAVSPGCVHWSVNAQAEVVCFDAEPATRSVPLTLALASSQEICTAGTLTEVSWAIAGGTPPYSLEIEGSPVAADTDGIRINCGPLPVDPFTGEMVARQTKVFRASVRDSRGVAVAALVAVTLAAPPYLAADTTLRYVTYDLTGAATSAGSYAFLSDADDAASVVTTYEGLRDGSAKGLLIHASDAQGASQRSPYAAVAAGDLFEWRQSYDCWVRYQVTEVKPDPPGAARRALLAVEQASYAFSGCSGAISTDAVLIAWGSLPDLGGPNLAAPVIHGPYQLVPEGWSGAVQEPRTYDPPGYSATNPIYTRDLAEARRLPYWRDPALPAGWTFSWVTVGDVSGPTYGYWAVFAAERGSLTIEGYYADYRGHPEEASWLNGRGAFETRTIAGRPARVAYSPPGPSHFDLFPVTVWIYDPSTETEYVVLGQVKRLHEANVDAVIAIARSLFEE